MSRVDSNPKHVLIDTKQLRSFVAPVWHEISSLWSGVDFSFSDPLPDSAAQLEQGVFPGIATGDPHTGVNQHHHQHCW